MAHAGARCRVKAKKGVLPHSRALPAILTDRAGYSCCFLVLVFVKLQAGKDNRVLHPDSLQAVGIESQRFQDCRGNPRGSNRGRIPPPPCTAR